MNRALEKEWLNLVDIKPLMAQSPFDYFRIFRITDAGRNRFNVLAATRAPAQAGEAVSLAEPEAQAA